LLKKLSNAAPAKAAVPPTSDQTTELLNRADDALSRKDYAEAVKALKAIIAIRPDLAAAWFDLGFAYTGLHQPDDAIAAYEKTVALAPDNFPAQLNLGVLLLEQKK